MNEISCMNRAADNIRVLTAAMVEKANSGHPGGAMGGADFINVLFSEFMEYDPENPAWENRDRFFLDPGHMSPMLYSVLAMAGKYSMDELQEFRQWQSATPGHPELNVARGIENSSGPLGQGHAIAVGAAIAERFLAARFGEWTKHTIYTFISDGGIQEEISQGVGRIAGLLGLANLIMFYDANNVQLSTYVDEVTSEDTARKYEAWGWKVLSIDGNDVEQIRVALTAAKQETERPTLIIGRTLMGKGAVGPNGECYANQLSTHGQPLSKAGVDVAKTILGLGGDPENPFVIFPEVQAMYQARHEELRQKAAVRRAEQQAWEKEYPDLAKKYHRFYAKDFLKEVDFSAVQQKLNQATRVSSATLLACFSEHIENMVVSSADLSNSDKTDGFLKHSKPFVRGDFSGGFLHAGVSELSMACIMNGMALHGGIIPVCGTFFVFSDYMKPAFRMSALMGLQVIYVWTHDAFRVGEDGPTHQPVEQELQVRLMEAMKNHQGKNSMLVLRPADEAETTVAWQMALENTDTPTGLILSRQNVTSLPRPEHRYQHALQAKQGAYIVKDAPNFDVSLVACGSEVATLMAATTLLEGRKGLKVRVVSIPSEGLFFTQPEAYRESVLDSRKPIFGLTAGLPMTLQRTVGLRGRVFGLEHFGYSAPYAVLDEKFGFTAENIYEQVLKYLAEF